MTGDQDGRFKRWVASMGGHDGERYRALYAEAYELAGPDDLVAYLEMCRQLDEDHAAWKRQRAARAQARAAETAAAATLRRVTEIKLATAQLAGHPRLVELAADAQHRHIPGTGFEWRHGWEPLTEDAARSHFGGKVPKSWHAPSGARRADSAAAAAVRRSVTPRPARGSVDAWGRQSWPLAKVGRLKSGNEPGLTVAQEYHRKAVLGRYSPNDWERARQAGFAHPRDHQASITAHVRQHGILNAAQASYGALDEGYHRYAAARQLGMRTMPVKNL